MDVMIATDVVAGTGLAVGPFCFLGVDPADDPVPLTIGDGATIRSHTVIYRATRIGHRFHAGHGVLVREHTCIGDDVSVGSHTVVEHHVTIGDGVWLHSNCFVPEYSILHDGAWLGPGVIVTNARYPNRPDTKDHLEGVHIGPGATVGAGAVLLPGITIGADALIGAGAVVIDDVQPGEKVVGNPGRHLT